MPQGFQAIRDVAAAGVEAAGVELADAVVDDPDDRAVDAGVSADGAEDTAALCEDGDGDDRAETVLTVAVPLDADEMTFDPLVHPAAITAMAVAATIALIGASARVRSRLAAARGRNELFMNILLW